MKHIGESLEDYLECILVLSRQLPVVRSVDVASSLGYSKPSVSHAVKLMLEQGYIELDTGKTLQLTEKGRAIACATWRRHVFFTNMLQQIGVPQEIAQEDACRMEHVVSQETFDAIRRYFDNNKEAGE